ncbi:MAG: DUF6434 domain-containing protein, partial [Pseudomonadota bacterium]
VASRAEFERWYWPVSELEAFCERLGLAKGGRKADLRERVAAALAGEALPAPKRNARSQAKGFNWSKEALTRSSIITESISFGPNVRGFFKREIGAAFVCHSDFMDWVKSNPGSTLGDAIDAWHMLEQRKDDPAFRREIAACNNYLRYLRAIRDAHPELTLEDAKRCWDEKKLRPAQDGFV